MIKRAGNNELCANRVKQMCRSTLSLITCFISLLLVSFVVVPGCTSTSPGFDGTTPVTSEPSERSQHLRYLLPYYHPPETFSSAGNVYGLSSDPYRGIDTITFSIGLPAHASSVDMTTMEIVFSTPGSAPVTLTQGTRESAGIFTTTRGGNAVTKLLSDEEVDIAFRIKPVSGRYQREY